MMKTDRVTCPPHLFPAPPSWVREVGERVVCTRCGTKFKVTNQGWVKL